MISPLRILRRLESDKLNTAPSSPEAMDDDTVTNREVLVREDRVDEEAVRNRSTAEWKVFTAEIREALDENEVELRIELESNNNLGRFELPTPQVNQSLLILALAKFSLSHSHRFWPITNSDSHGPVHGPD